MNARFVVPALVLGALFVACSGETSPSGLGEPLRVRNGVFKEGPLPGSPPGAAPLITAIETASTVLRPGQGEKSVTGRASPGAVAVGLAFPGLGSGYWLVQVEGPDPLNNGELGFQAVVEIARSVPAGPRELRMVAIDERANAGEQRALPVCVPGIVPDNLSACDPSILPPASVISLSWDTQVDLDLVVVAPDGRVIDAKHPRALASPPDSGDTPAEIDRDSNGACVLDRVQRENLVFPETPPAGTYVVYANLFDACERAPVHFRVTVSSRQPGPDGKTLALVESFSREGILLAVSANGGARLGTFVTEVSF